MKAQDKIPPEEQKEYILLENTCTNYKVTRGWEPGTMLKRVSKWLSGNGCGVKQAYFIAVGSNKSPQIAWQDHVEEITGQLKLDI
ncbi:hypothetical protein QNH20_19290 [Neobacillus sp. WH10]|uniref:hypothetical protein n=1 Tax=Neobacillus sp. WH10 TaxID=3047873 RepID=UPI0024C2040E|nr:hypothetical protein [Neobacillus sp. WH10]WHY76251.1 hypothetical protein QNH20_19290 [Neobacillus sp. WH10]